MSEISAIELNCFKITRLPLLCRIYKLLYEANTSPQKPGLLKKIFFYRCGRLLFPKLFKLISPYSSHGQFVYSRNEQNAIVKFRAGNTQFHSIYFDQYKHGYELETSVAIKYLLGNDDVFYDIGANWGHYSLYVASLLGYKGKVVAFEPNPGSYHDLVDAVNQVGLNDIITSIHAALGKEQYNAMINIPDNLHSGSAFISGKKGKIKVITLDAFIADNVCMAPDLIKIDVEGFEEDVLLGALDTIKQKKTTIIFENWVNLLDVDTTIKPFIILENIGYQFFVPVLKNKKYRDLWCGYGGPFDGVDDVYGLRLIKCNYQERLLFSAQINFIAIHKDKINTYSHLF